MSRNLLRAIQVNPTGLPSARAGRGFDRPCGETTDDTREPGAARRHNRPPRPDPRSSPNCVPCEWQIPLKSQNPVVGLRCISERRFKPPTQRALAPTKLSHERGNNVPSRPVGNPLKSTRCAASMPGSGKRRDGTRPAKTSSRALIVCSRPLASMASCARRAPGPMTSSNHTPSLQNSHAPSQIGTFPT
jgi:hypothetical protein